MTIKDYFQSKMSMLNIPITEESLTIFLNSKNHNTSETTNDFRGLDIVFLEIILMVLATPNISEGDMSISYNREGLIKFYKAECKRLGVEDVLSKADAPKVRDMSYLA